MNWEAPSFVEVRMDAEINAYQDDFKERLDAQEQVQQTVNVPVDVATNRIK